ncbi:MAG: SOS response-associated peptidase family protein [Acetobacteraceae bacterium]|nr:SOS response-associated peptidase family protein [Acetobacteraceae bacterium]
MGIFGAVDLHTSSPRPFWNIAPGASVAGWRWDARRRRRVLVPTIWGLLAPWEKHWGSARLRPINARCEAIATSRLFGPAFRRQPALIAADAGYEWALGGRPEDPLRPRPQQSGADSPGRDVGLLEESSSATA